MTNIEKEKNLCGKTRNVNDPYEIWLSYDGTWGWRVLKKYQKPSLEAKIAALKKAIAKALGVEPKLLEKGDQNVSERKGEK